MKPWTRRGFLEACASVLAGLGILRQTETVKAETVEYPPVPMTDELVDDAVCLDQGRPRHAELTLDGVVVGRVEQAETERVERPGYSVTRAWLTVDPTPNHLRQDVMYGALMAGARAEAYSAAADTTLVGRLSEYHWVDADGYLRLEVLLTQVEWLTT